MRTSTPSMALDNIAAIPVSVITSDVAELLTLNRAAKI